MSIITISRGSYSYGKEIAERVAQRLGYACIAREVLFEASEEFDIPEIKLVRSIHDAPSILERFTHGKEKYIAFIQAALLKHLQKGNVVYHGLAGHFFVKGIPHVLKVRIVADLDERVRLEMDRENILKEEALRVLKNDDGERRRWSKHLYGIDTWDPSLYDMVLHMRKFTLDDAVDIICHSIAIEHFRPTPQSQQAMDDLVLAAEVKAALVDLKPDVEVSANSGFVQVRTKARKSQSEGLTRDIEKIAGGIAGVRQVEVQVLSQTRIKGYS
jgi:cytidylate kinase